MGPWSTQDERVKPLIRWWLQEQTPVYVDLYIPHSAGPGTPYLVSSLDQFEQLIANAPINAVITVFENSFTFSGALDDEMVEAFRAAFSEGEHWHVLEGVYYPEETERLASGTTWSELKAELMEGPERRGQLIFIGKELDCPLYWLENTDPNLLILRRT